MQPITSIAALWQEATTDPEFGFALKAQGVRVDLATAVARSAIPKSQLATQLGWTSDRLEKALTGSGDLSLQTIFAITRALGLDFKVVITTADATSATDGKTKEEIDAPEICPACGLGQLTRYIEREEVESHERTWRIPLHFSECDACGAELTNGEQSRANVEAMKKIELKAKLQASNNRDLTPITVQATGFISSNVAMLWSFCCAGVTSVPKVATSKTQNALQANGKMEVKNE